jgi:hypothetical protein
MGRDHGKRDQESRINIPKVLKDHWKGVILFILAALLAPPALYDELVLLC